MMCCIIKDNHCTPIEVSDNKKSAKIIKIKYKKNKYVFSVLELLCVIADLDQQLSNKNGCWQKILVIYIKTLGIETSSSKELFFILFFANILMQKVMHTIFSKHLQIVNCQEYLLGYSKVLRLFTPKSSLMLP